MLFLPQGVSPHLLLCSDLTVSPHHQKGWGLTVKVSSDPAGALSSNIILIFSFFTAILCASVCKFAGRGVEVYTFIKTLPNVSTATSCSPADCHPLRCVAWSSTFFLCCFSFFFHTVSCISRPPSSRPSSTYSLLPPCCSVWALSSGCSFHFGTVLSMYCCIRSSQDAAGILYNSLSLPVSLSSSLLPPIPGKKSQLLGNT